MGKVTYVAVLAHGEADEADITTRQRIDAAVKRVHEIYDEGMSEPILVFMAGIGRQDSLFTLATYMLLYARECLRRRPALADVQIVYNCREHEVWGTILEMEWALKTIRAKCPSAEIEYVTNARHGARVTLVSRMLHRVPCKITVSKDTPPPLWHETLAYLKVVAHVIGRHKKLESLRRRFYSGG